MVANIFFKVRLKQVVMEWATGTHITTSQITLVPIVSPFAYKLEALYDQFLHYNFTTRVEPGRSCTNPSS